MNRINVSLQQSIIALVERGWSKRRIARELQLDRATVRRLLRTTANAASNPAHGARPGPPSLCAPFATEIEAAVAAGLSAQPIYQDLISEHGFRGGYSSVKQFVRRLSAHKTAGRAWSFVEITLPTARQPVNRDTFRFTLLKEKLREAEARDGHYLLRGFRAGDTAGPLWERYMELAEIEAAFKTLKSDLDLRPIRHHGERRIEAHIPVCLLAYCLSVTLRLRLAAHAPGLTPRTVLETVAGILMLDVHVPLADGRELVLPRCTQPEPEHRSVAYETRLGVAAATAAAHPHGARAIRWPPRDTKPKM